MCEPCRNLWRPYERACVPFPGDPAANLGPCREQGGSCSLGAASVPHLNVAPIDVHAADHAALRGDVCPVDHLLPIVKIQSHCVVQALGGREKH